MEFAGGILHAGQLPWAILALMALAALCEAARTAPETLWGDLEDEDWDGPEG